MAASYVDESMDEFSHPRPCCDAVYVHFIYLLLLNGYHQKI